MYTAMLGGKYHADSSCPMGRMKNFTGYIQEFGETATGHGLDVGAGPEGCNGKFFKACSQLDGTDIQVQVVNSFDSQAYTRKLVNDISKQPLPYDDATLDFIVCSCVFHHFESHEQLEKALREMARVLKPGGSMFIIYKAGTHGTKLTHYHKLAKQYRTVTVFDKEAVNQILANQNLSIQKEETLADLNWVPYVCTIAKKIPNQE